MAPQQSFDSVLIANRGEIASRIIRACKEVGLRSIAVYSDADEHAPFVREADVAVRIGPTPAAESYLSIEKILAAATESGAQAIHPGYGFLSENATFAAAVRDAGLVFIGPTPEVIEVMGRKDRARDIAQRAGVPVTPRYEEGGADGVPADAYPVLVKAAAGGGGKGMHVVRDPVDLADAVAKARREAASAFGDDTLLIEKYVERGYHVEVQVMGDEHGTVVHLFTRDCSAQRRHQKVVEEAPAPWVSDEIRERIQDASVALCREVGYTGAGTVEFLVESQAGVDTAYFLEMNTRLQVEHCVTEQVTGVDLVAWQFAVAAGQEIPLPQEAIVCTGHAVEVRIYAEDPYAEFVPQTGRVATLLRSGLARNEWGIEQGSTVGTSYDPMLAKVITSGADRSQALGRMVEALDETAVLGVTTNTGFLRRLVASDAFADGEVHSSWLDGSDAEALLSGPTLPDDVPALAAQAWAAEYLYPDLSPFGALDGWRSGQAAVPLTVRMIDDHGTTHSLEVDLHPVVDPGIVKVDRAGAWVVIQGHPWRLDRPDATRRAAVAAGDADVVSPMPGTVIDLAVAEGDTVEAGQRLGAVEAMKMELALTAPHAGRVTKIGAAVGDQVAMGHVIVRVEEEEEGSE